MAKTFREQYRKRGKKDLRKQHEEQQKRKDIKRRYPTVFLVNKFPKNVELYKVTETDHLIDFIPFFAGKNHPHAKEGKSTYVVEFHTHNNIGRSKDVIVCPYETYGDPCPVCDFIKNSGFLHTKVWSALRTSRRVAYLVWGHNDREQEKKGIQILTCSHKYMEEVIDELARNPYGGGSLLFSDVDEGQTLMFTRKGTGRDTKYVGHKFLPRAKSIPDKILDKSFPLDDVIEMRRPIKKLKKLFNDEVIEEWTALNEKLLKEEERKKKSKSDKKKKKNDKKSKSSKKDKKHKSSKSKKDKKKKKKGTGDDVPF